MTLDMFDEALSVLRRLWRDGEAAECDGSVLFNVAQAIVAMERAQQAFVELQEREVGE